jgi:YfiH family protein
MVQFCETAENFIKTAPWVHGFFGSKGGVSSGSFTSLNGSLSVGDEAENVRVNRQRTLEALGIAGFPLILMNQVHGAEVATLSDAQDLAACLEAPPSVDGLVSRLKGVSLGVLTADCAPILWMDPEAEIVGACHAGWRGALAGIVQNMCAAMEALGSKRDTLLVAVGPMIHQSAYEVGEDFREIFIEQNPGAEDCFRSAHGSYFFNLPGFLKKTLLAQGLPSLWVSPSNTYEGSFFSFRRSQKDFAGKCGRNLSLIAQR